MTAPLFVVLTGPSGAGKDTVLQALKARPGTNFAATVNATTRNARPGERNGVDYLFVSKEEFARMVREGEMLEHAIVYGQEKGVPKAPVRKALANGQDVAIRTDIQGARHIKSVAPGVVTVFLAPPSQKELEKRLRERGGDSEEQAAIRLETAREEMAAAGEFDYIVVNDDVERAVAEIAAIIEKERGRPGRRPVELR